MSNIARQQFDISGSKHSNLIQFQLSNCVTYCSNVSYVANIAHRRVVMKFLMTMFICHGYI